MDMDIGYFIDTDHRGHKGVQVFQKVWLTRRGHLTVDLLLMAMRSGKMVQDVGVVCDLADRMMTEIEKRGWLLNVPDPIPPRDREAIEETQRSGEAG